MPNEIHFSNEYTLSGKGVLNPRFIELDELNVKHWFPIAVQEFNDVFDSYQLALSDDGKITGEERTDIMNELDDFFNLLVSFYVYINENPVKSFNISIMGYNFNMNVSIVQNIWTINGNYSEAFLSATENFKIFFTNRLVKDFRELVFQFKEYPAGEEHISKPVIREKMKDTCTRLLYNTLKIRFQLERCMIND